MDRLVYLSMAGAKAAMQRQETLAHNLANSATPGFRAELQAFRAVPVEGGGASTRVFAIETTPGYDASPGPIASTGRHLDVAMRGDAWLSVQGRDGTEAYTRGGSLDINAEGTLVTTSGTTVLGDGGPIQVPEGAAVSIASDGTVSATAANGISQAVGRLKMVTPEAPLIRGEDGLFRAVDGDLGADATARLQDGALEGSNVSPVETMIAMITAARQFEAQMRLLSSAEGNDKAASQLLSAG